MRPSVVTHAFLLRRVALGEADLMLTLFTRDLGKVSAFAKAARKSQRRFSGALEVATCFVADLQESGNRMLLQEAQVHTSLPGPTDPTVLAHVSYVLEICEALLPEGIAEPNLFDTLQVFFSGLPQVRDVRLGLRRFEIQLLTTLGLAPSFSQCVSCSLSRPKSLSWRVDTARGGVLCPPCDKLPLGNSERENGLALDFLAEVSLAAMGESQENPGEAGDSEALETLGIGQWNDSTVQNHARQIMHSVIHWHIGRPLKSIEFWLDLKRPISAEVH